MIFAEGIESIGLACSLVLLLPAVGVVLVGSPRPRLVGLWIATVTLIAWTRFAGWFTLDPSGALHISVGLVLVAVVALAAKLDTRAAPWPTTSNGSVAVVAVAAKPGAAPQRADSTDPTVVANPSPVAATDTAMIDTAATDTAMIDMAIVVLAGLVVSWTWVPCVGRELGDILNAARTQPWRQSLPTLLYMTGLFLPVIVVTAATIAVPLIGQVLSHRAARIGGLLLFGLVGLLVSFAWFDDLAGELARRSSW